LQELVSVVSKGGNFLLNIGPEASGHIPHVMSRTLRAMGSWIDKVEESIFDAVPYWVTSHDFFEPGQPLYFMQSKNGQTFYVFSFEKPLGGRLVVKTTLPLHAQSRISLMTFETTEYLDWRIFSNGRLMVTVPDHILDQERLLWVFKVEAP
jgi:alpha-L-fucosidase